MTQTSARGTNPRKPPLRPAAAHGGVPAPRTRRRSPIPRLCILLALVIGGLRWVLLGWAPHNPAGANPLAARLVELHSLLRQNTEWAYPMTAILLVAGLALWLLGCRRRRHQADEARIVAVAATALRVSAALINLRSADWHRGALIRGRIHYPRGTVVSDLSEDLANALAAFADGPLQVEWLRRKDRFMLRPRPPRAPRVEEEHAAVRQVYLPFEHLMPGVAVDQHRTSVNQQGDLEQMVVTYPATTRDIGDGYRQRVQAVLDAKAPSPTGYWSLQWDPAASSVTIHPSAPLPTSVPYPLTAPTHQLRIPVGMGEGGVVAEWDPVSNPHLLIVGPTGNGKTIFLNNLITGALARSWTVSIGDPKVLSYRGFDPDVLTERGLPVWPGISTVAITNRGIERVIDEAHQLVDRRYEQIRNFEIREHDLQPHMLVLDEISELVARLNAYQSSEEKILDLQAEAAAAGADPDEIAKPKGTKNPEVFKIWSLLRMGRQCRVFVVLATQRPDVSYIPGDARDNVLAKGGLGKLSGHALEMVFGTRAIQQRVHEMGTDPTTGRRTRMRIPGRATLDLGSGPMTVQPFWTPDPAKAITGELAPQDQKLVADLHTFVTTHHQTAGVAPAVDADCWRTPTTALTLPLPTSTDEPTTHEQIDGLSPVFDDIDQDAYRELSAAQLTTDQIAMLEVDGRPTLIRILEVEQEPFGEDDELQVTYEIVGDDERAGQPGVTTLTAREQVLVE